MRTNDFNNKQTLPTLLDSFLNDLKVSEPVAKYMQFKPAVNIKEDENGFYLDAAAPGFSKKDIKIDVDNELMTISAEVEDVEETFKRREFTKHSFKRSFTLPKTVDTDKISAAFKNGILSITIPKKEESKPKPAKEIKIS